jgi:hypothetical protein
MLAAFVTLALFSQSGAAITLSSGTDVDEVQAIGPHGELAAQVYTYEAATFEILKNGKPIKTTPLDTALFRFFGDDPVGYHVEAFLPDGSFYGTATCSTSGAMTITEAHPFVARRGIMTPVEIPEMYKKFDMIIMTAVLPDGSALLQVQKDGSWLGFDDPHGNAEHLIWVRDGRVLADLGPAVKPIIDSVGRIVATQYELEGSPAASNSYGANPGVAVLEQGQIKRICEGKPLAILDDGAIIVERFFPDPLPKAADTDDPIPQKRTGRTSLEVYRNGVFSPFTPPPGLESPGEILSYNGSSYVRGTRAGIPVLQSLNAPHFFPLPSSLPLNSSIECAAYNRIAWSVYDESAAQSHHYVQPLGPLTRVKN